MDDEHFAKLKREIEMTEDPDHLDFNGRDFGYKIGKFGIPFCVGAIVLGKIQTILLSMPRNTATMDWSREVAWWGDDQRFDPNSYHFSFDFGGGAVRCALFSKTR